MKTSPIKQTGSYHIVSYDGKNDIYSDPSNVITILSLSRNCTKLKDITPNPEEFGIFEFMRRENTEMGVFLNSICGENGLYIPDFVNIDVEYIYNHSGEKSLSGLVKTFLQKWNKNVDTQYPLTVKNFESISAVIRARFLRKWKQLWDTLVLEYDVLNPFDVKFSDKTVRDHMTSTDKRNYSDSEDGKGFTYGYNDTTPDGSPVDRSQGSSQGESGSEYTRDSEYERETHRQGNIGNITRQQLIRQQRELLQYQFFDTVFADVDKVLTINIYD